MLIVVFARYLGPSCALFLLWFSSGVPAEFQLIVTSDYAQLIVTSHYTQLIVTSDYAQLIVTSDYAQLIVTSDS